MDRVPSSNSRDEARKILRSNTLM